MLAVLAKTLATPYCKQDSRNNSEHPSNPILQQIFKKTYSRNPSNHIL